MKNIKKLLFLIIAAVMLMPSMVLAASAKYTISGPTQGVVGNNITLTVYLSSGSSLGGWDTSLSYDKSYLQLSDVIVSGNDKVSATRVVGTADKTGVKKKTFTYKFKVLKSGTTTVSTTNTDVYDFDNLSSLSVENGAIKMTLKTQAEIEASYSSNAYLKSLTVVGYDLTPAFNKETNTYDVEVENDVEKVTINASKEDGNASVSGTGEKELLEGPNKFDIVVTAQKGNSLTYTVNVNRKELNPIKVNVNGKELGIVRKKDLLDLELMSYTDNNTIGVKGDISSELITFLDPSIESLSIEEVEKGTSTGEIIKLKFYGKDEITLYNKNDLNVYLSSGTVKGLNVFKDAEIILRNGGYLVVDELENHFNKEIVSTLMGFFADNKINKNGATLIFSTHYPELLDNVNRNDCIYITRNINIYFIYIFIFWSKPYI